VDVTENDDDIEIDLDSGKIVNVTKKKSFNTPPFPPVIQEIIRAGGMESFVRNKLKSRTRALYTRKNEISRR